MKTKIFYGNQFVGAYDLNKSSWKSRIKRFIKKTTKVIALVCIALWCLVGVFKFAQYQYPKVVYADREVPIKLKLEDIPMLVKICNAESGGKQFTKSGDVLRGKIDASDIGFCQINERYNNDEARRLGYDIFTEQGNKDFAVYLFLKKGTQPWDASKSVWSK